MRVSLSISRQLLRITAIVGLELRDCTKSMTHSFADERVVDVFALTRPHCEMALELDGHPSQLLRIVVLALRIEDGAADVHHLKMSLREDN